MPSFENKVSVTGSPCEKHICHYGGHVPSWWLNTQNADVSGTKIVQAGEKIDWK